MLSAGCTYHLCCSHLQEDNLPGRTHQIRIHFSSIGHPLVGDFLYGSKSDFINRQALHSYHISFIHPISNKIMDIYCELPEDMKKIG